MCGLVLCLRDEISLGSFLTVFAVQDTPQMRICPQRDSIKVIETLCSDSNAVHELMGEILRPLLGPFS